MALAPPTGLVNDSTSSADIGQQLSVKQPVVAPDGGRTRLGSLGGGACFLEWSRGVRPDPYTSHGGARSSRPEGGTHAVTGQ